MHCPHCKTDFVGPDVPRQNPGGYVSCPLCGENINSSPEYDPGCAEVSAVWLLSGLNAGFLALLLDAVTYWDGGWIGGAAFLLFCYNKGPKILERCMCG